MDLTERLWRFWSNLNQGDIDFELMYHRMSDAERNKASSWLLEREFAVSVPRDSIRSEGGSRKPIYVVISAGGVIHSPEDKNGTWCFTGKSYAQQYKEYLRAQSARTGLDTKGLRVSERSF